MNEEYVETAQVLHSCYMRSGFEAKDPKGTSPHSWGIAKRMFNILLQ